MLALDFRRSPERVAAFRELLQNPIFADAIVVLKDEKPSAAVPSGTDAYERAAALGRIEQHENSINLLLSLAEPLPPELPEEQATFGVDLSQFQHKPHP
jgi:hypothetical protein